MTITSSLRFLYILGDLAYCAALHKGFVPVMHRKFTLFSPCSVYSEMLKHKGVYVHTKCNTYYLLFKVQIF